MSRRFYCSHCGISRALWGHLCKDCDSDERICECNPSFAVPSALGSQEVIKCTKE